MANPVVHFEITGRDGAALRTFYGQLFDWEFQLPPGMDYGMVQAGERGIGGGVGTAPDGTGAATFYVEVDDVQAALDRAEELGGKTVVPVMTVPGMVTFGLFADPEGHVVGLVASEVPPAA
jgi:predicted enzyme related to lactoylglutathione lyase